MLHVMVDDTRDSTADLIIRNGELAQQILPVIKNEIGTLYLDHDLGFGMTGYALVQWVVEQGILPFCIILLTSNPVGFKNMRDYLMTHGGYEIGENESILYKKG